MASALEILDAAVVNVALPQMSGNLGATPDEIAWVSAGQVLALYPAALVSLSL